MEFKNLKEGTKIEGVVYDVKDNELIVTVDGSPVEGTITLDHLTKKPVASAKELFKKGDAITAVVRKKDDEILLLSRLPIETEQAFNALQDLFTQDKMFKVRVKGANKGGLSVEFEGYDCFMPASEVSVSYTSDLSTFAGKELNVKVIEIRREKVVVSHKMVEKESEKIAKQEELETIKVGDILEGKVVKLLDFGAFVRFNHAEGLIHISELSHHKVAKVSDVLKEGQTVKVKVIDAKGDKRGLSLKALEKTPWEQYADAHKVGEKVTGKVVKKMQFGFLVELSKDVVGMVNKLDYSWDPNYNLAGAVEVGDEIEVQIISVDVKRRRMALSKKHLEYNPWQDVKVKEGEKVSGEVKEIQSSGALVEINGVNAYLPIGEIKEERVERVQDELKEGDVINAIVKKFNPKMWQMVISKVAYEQKAIREEYQKYMKTENQDDQTQTLGDLFAEKFASLKK